MKYAARLCMVALAVAGMTAGAHATTGDKIGETQMCVPMDEIDRSIPVDDKTILLIMHFKNQYKRVDLQGTCPGLWINRGFSSSATSVNKFCVTDTLKVANEPVGPICTMKRIVTISPAEAKVLLARSQHAPTDRSNAAPRNVPDSAKE